MPADVIPIGAARQRAPRNPRAVQAETRGALVVLLTPAREVPLTPAGARTLAAGLLVLADSAEEVTRGK